MTHHEQINRTVAGFVTTNKRKGVIRLGQKARGQYLTNLDESNKMDKAPSDYRPALKCAELVITRNVVNPMYAPRGKQRAEDSIKSEWWFVMNRIALQDLGRSERRQTYTYGLSLHSMKYELYEQGRCEYRKDCKPE
jgi:hypothetical protein